MEKDQDAKPPRQLKAGPGRIAGLKRNGRTIEAIAKEREKIYGVQLAAALGGDSGAARLCLELIGDLPSGRKA